MIGKPQPDSRICRAQNQTPFEVVWASENATLAELSHPGRTRVVKPSGSITFCGNSGDVVTLVVSGPGGAAQASTTL